MYHGSVRNACSARGYDQQTNNIVTHPSCSTGIFIAFINMKISAREFNIKEYPLDIDMRGRKREREGEREEHEEINEYAFQYFNVIIMTYSNCKIYISLHNAVLSTRTIVHSHSGWHAVVHQFAFVQKEYRCSTTQPVWLTIAALQPNLSGLQQWQKGTDWTPGEPRMTFVIKQKNSVPFTTAYFSPRKPSYSKHRACWQHDPAKLPLAVQIRYCSILTESDYTVLCSVVYLLTANHTLINKQTYQTQQIYNELQNAMHITNTKAKRFVWSSQWRSTWPPTKHLPAPNRAVWWSTGRFGNAAACFHWLFAKHGESCFSKCACFRWLVSPTS